MADKEVSGTTAASTPLTGAELLHAVQGGNSRNVAASEIALLAGLACNGRLTLSTGVPVTASDVTAAGTVYFTPNKGNIVWLYTGSTWVPHFLSELSLALSGLTASKPADIFLDYNAGTPQLVGTSWTNDTTRATALTLQDGVPVQTGNTDWRYLGTIYVDGSNQCADSFAKRHVWNMYNRVARPMRVLEGTDNWNYTTATFRQANGSTANQLDFVRGLNEDAVLAEVGGLATNPSTSVVVRVAVGLDSTTTPVSGCRLATVETLVANRLIGPSASWRGLPSPGRHTLVWLEHSAATGTTTWYGDNGDATVLQTGIVGELFA